MDLNMTEDELAMFSGSQPLVPNSGIDGDNIVVRYSDSHAINPMIKSHQPAEPGYATVNEIAILEKKKEKKLGRKISKSIQKAIKPGKEDKHKSRSSQGQGLGGPEMGFKPQFHSNPLLKLGESIPPTPPPTPATAASSAPSDESKILRKMHN